MSSIEQAEPYIYSLIGSLVVLLLTIIPIGFARYSQKFSLKYLEEPRLLSFQYKSWGRRAVWAHENSFEAFIIHVPALLLALLITFKGSALPQVSSDFACLHPFFRLLYIITYLINRPILRSFFWGAGLISSLIIYFTSVMIYLSH